MDPFFELAEPQIITDVESLLSLNVEKTYYYPGNETPVIDLFDLHSSSFSTSGIFRGQLQDWPLIPKAYREANYLNLDARKIMRRFEWTRATRKFSDFCERAGVQNMAFPSAISDRMSIAQHFGVPTPLLDWSQNIFTAVFFAIRDVFADSELEKSLQVFIYHIADERLLNIGIPDDSKLSDFEHSAFIKPYPIDRRI